MVTVAVVGASGNLGRAVLERLDADGSVGTIIGVDAAGPEMPVAKLDFLEIDPCEPLPATIFDGADVVVSLTAPEEATSAAATLDDMRGLLDAVAAAGARALVHRSSALVYGAHPDNRVPLAEGSPLRANPGFAPAYRAMLAEQLIDEFAAHHPSVRSVVLRPATVLGAGVDSPTTRHLESLRLPLVRGYEPIAQFVDVEDLAAAVHLAVGGDLSGAYNVAAEGWLTASEICALVGRRCIRIPEAEAFWLAQGLWRIRALRAPPEALRYLMYPWVVDTRRLRSRGWAPTTTNREILRAFGTAHYGYVSLGRVRLRRRTLRLAAAGLVLAGSAGTARRSGRRR